MAGREAIARPGAAAKAGKVTVSVPAATLAAVERARRRLRKTRSAVVREALADWLRSQDAGGEDRRYVEAYLRVPEREVDSATLAAGAVAEWDRSALRPR